ncbi:M14 family metallopeptidase [Aridibaculum aurantiacum]|uniref:M14 family metallopeptidase n=1 Tax=Aridibaculum aurantiacum TaxID=2810307 RepID=UPI001A9755FF|nr:M14 family metallopeptidase [Aridibaculum aurantiacum]
MIKGFFLSLAVLVVSSCFSQSLEYYLPKNVQYDPAIPTPKSVIFHEVGEWHVAHDRLVSYMQAVANASPRITFQVIGHTYEGRPQVVLTITSPENHARLEQVRQQHVQLTNPNESASLNIDQMPAVVWIGNSIHGNESSGSNAALLAAYYLAAARGPQVDELLRNTVILLDPSFNPDGLNRFASWVNTHKSNTAVTDPQAREYNEVWPGGRFNHYWFDLNRDWLPAQHVESQNRLKIFHDWKPNILTDHHEMGSNATFFFQPGVPSRVNPNTPMRNQELTAAIANFHARNLDSIGSFYFTKEGYDDFYYGKGSTYPDIQGSIGILFEQASSRGHAQETDNGLLTFPFTIRNQFVTMLSTLDAAKSLRKDLLNYQRNFFSDAMKEANSFASKGFVFGDAKDKSKTQKLVEMMLRHQIDVYELKQQVNAEGKTFAPGSSYFVPTAQPQFKLIKTMFEKTTEYKDSLFYDVTAWTLPLAFNLEYAGVASVGGLAGAKVTAASEPKGNIVGGLSNYSYAFNWEEYYAPRLLYALQKAGVKVRVASRPLQVATAAGVKQMTYGAIMIPVQQQGMTPQALYNLLLPEVQRSGVEVFNVSSGMSAGGIDLGSGSFLSLKQPQIMLFAGNGTTALDVGEIWHLLDQKFQIPVSIVEAERFNAINPGRYNVIIMPSGRYTTLDKTAQDKLRQWVTNGGTLIATEDATRFLSTNGFTKVIFRGETEKKDTVTNLPYHLQSDETRAKDMTGSIFEARMDLTHPLCYGYSRPTISVFKSNNLFMDQNNNPYDSPVMYTDNPLQSGYMFKGHRENMRNSAVINIDQLGKGKIISMVDNLNFRAFWYGTSKLFMNAIFFGENIRL